MCSLSPADSMPRKFPGKSVHRRVLLGTAAVTAGKALSITAGRWRCGLCCAHKLDRYAQQKDELPVSAGMDLTHASCGVRKARPQIPSSGYLGGRDGTWRTHLWAVFYLLSVWWVPGHLLFASSHTCRCIIGNVPCTWECSQWNRF